MSLLETVLVFIIRAPMKPSLPIITLLAYCPELNPAEKLWGIVKDGICNQLWADLESLGNAIT